MADKRLLSDRFLKSLKPAEPGTRDVYWDTLNGFGVCVYDNIDPARRGKAGRIAFIMYTRFKRGAAPARRIIGEYGVMKLEEARSTAIEWRSLIAKGIDPAVEVAKARETAEREAALRVHHAFSTVAETFIADKLSQERKGKEAERNLRNVFIAAWRNRPISEITKQDVRAIIDAKRRHAKQMARVLMALIRRFFNWALDQDIYGLDRSPCDRLSMSRIIGAVPKRNRRLCPDELLAFWQATGEMEYPTGPVYRMLLLTGLRLNECAQLSWSEVQGDTIVIPPERMKGKDATAVEHLVPITAAMREIIDMLPRHRGFLFSLSEGKRPLAMTGPIKADLDRRMLLTLKAMARDDDEHVTLPHWTNHDLRRTVRSGLSALDVPHNVAEMVLAHRQQGVVGTYDVYGYVPQCLSWKFLNRMNHL